MTKEIFMEIYMLCSNAVLSSVGKILCMYVSKYLKLKSAQWGGEVVSSVSKINSILMFVFRSEAVFFNTSLSKFYSRKVL